VFKGVSSQSSREAGLAPGKVGWRNFDQQYLLNQKAYNTTACSGGQLAYWGMLYSVFDE